MNYSHGYKRGNVGGPVGAVPIDRAHRYAVAICRNKAQLVVRHLNENSRDHGGHVFTRGGNRNLAHGISKNISGYLAGAPRHHGNRWILLKGHGQQCERGFTARDDNSAVLSGKNNGCVRKPTGNISQKSARDKHASWLINRCRDLGGGGCLVIKGGQNNSRVGRLNENTAEHGMIELARKQFHGKRNCVAKHVAVDLKFHNVSFF